MSLMQQMLWDGGGSVSCDMILFQWVIVSNYILREYSIVISEKENWRILTNKEIYAGVKKSTIKETIRLNRLRWFGHVQRMEENRIPKRVL